MPFVLAQDREEIGIVVSKCLNCVNSLSGAVCAPGPVPLPGFAVVPEGQKREGRGLLVCPCHHPPV